MIGNLIKCWHERLFYVERKNVIFRHSDLKVEMIPVTKENASWVRMLRGAEYEKQFLDQLGMGDFGYFACVDGKAVGYTPCQLDFRLHLCAVQAHVRQCTPYAQGHGSEEWYGVHSVASL